MKQIIFIRNKAYTFIFKKNWKKIIKIISGNDTVASSDSGFTSPTRTTPSTTPVGTFEKYRLEKGVGRPSLLVKHSSVVRTMQNLTQAQNHAQEPLSVQSHRVQTQNREEKEKRRVRHSDLRTSKFNSHAVGIAASRQYGFECDFVRNPIYGSAGRSSLLP